MPVAVHLDRASDAQIDGVEYHPDPPIRTVLFDFMAGALGATIIHCINPADAFTHSGDNIQYVVFYLEAWDNDSSPEHRSNEIVSRHEVCLSVAEGLSDTADALQ
ncbi:hypothetical protein PSCICP_31840 [Pseudomonas cichorii]|uniref:Uncharacterized protein n=1 Tax=Pseudomonas cichorii TaxID=36746 RepID=A0ABQ1DQF2_PSECI|nr:hypothetical protein PSCICP_31840 [Pseudomonas cichorii]